MGIMHNDSNKKKKYSRIHFWSGRTGYDAHLRAQKRNSGQRFGAFTHTAGSNPYNIFAPPRLKKFSLSFIILLRTYTSALQKEGSPCNMLIYHWSFILSILVFFFLLRPTITASECVGVDIKSGSKEKSTL